MPTLKFTPDREYYYVLGKEGEGWEFWLSTRRYDAPPPTDQFQGAVKFKSLFFQGTYYRIMRPFAFWKMDGLYEENVHSDDVRYRDWIDAKKARKRAQN